ncbi:MAG: helix-turn-helix domain-containing protein [Cyclobacteriaceae bacterium]|nr:helix-turn-helix domain-containing protein [Cyclobacteriaceae bacterium]
MESGTILNTINIILIIAIAQGILITVLIFHRYSALYPNRFLGSLMLIFSLSLVHVYLEEQGIYGPMTIGTLLPAVIFLLGPLHYLYTKYLVHQPRKFEKAEMLHLAPFVIIAGFVLMVSGGWIPQYYGSILLEEQESGFIAINWLYVGHVLTYYALTMRELAWYSDRIRQVFSSIESIRLHWLRLLTYLAIAVVLIFLTENILNLLHFNLSAFHLSTVLGAIYVYGMGYFGISRTPVFKNTVMEEVTRDLPDDYSGDKQNQVKYGRSGLSDEKAKTYAEKLAKLMKENQLYLDSNLTLQQLAQEAGISTHYLSQIINSHFGYNFFDFVNEFRVNYVINNLINEKKKHLTILAIGLEAGFNSKTTFNTIFKKFTGKTPSQYRSNLLQSS